MKRSKMYILLRSITLAWPGLTGIAIGSVTDWWIGVAACVLCFGQLLWLIVTQNAYNTELMKFFTDSYDNLEELWEEENEPELRAIEDSISSTEETN